MIEAIEHIFKPQELVKFKTKLDQMIKAKEKYQETGGTYKNFNECKNFNEGKSLIAPSELDKRGTKMKLPNIYNNKNWGNVTKVSNKTVTVKSSGKDGKIYCRRTIASK